MNGSGDDLSELLAVARRAAPEVPGAVWERIDRAVRADFGATRIYVAARRKQRLLEAIATAQPVETVAQQARRLGVSERRVRQLRALSRAP